MAIRFMVRQILLSSDSVGLGFGNGQFSALLIGSGRASSCLYLRVWCAERSMDFLRGCFFFEGP